MGEVDRWEKSEKLKTVQCRLHQQVLIPPPTSTTSRYAAVHHCVTVLSHCGHCPRTSSASLLLWFHVWVSTSLDDVSMIIIVKAWGQEGRAPIWTCTPKITQHTTSVIFFLYKRESCAQVQIYWGFHPSSNAWLQLGVSLWQHEKRFIWERSSDQPILICLSQMKGNWSGCSGTNQEPLSYELKAAGASVSLIVLHHCGKRRGPCFKVTSLVLRGYDKYLVEKMFWSGGIKIELFSHNKKCLEESMWGFHSEEHRTSIMLC